MKTVTFKGQAKKQGEGVQSLHDAPPKTLKKLKIGLTRQQVQKMAVKTLKNGGMSVPDPETPPQNSEPRSNPPRRNMMDDFNRAANALPVDRPRRSPLEMAAEKGDVDVVEALLRQRPEMAPPRRPRMPSPQP